MSIQEIQDAQRLYKKEAQEARAIFIKLCGGRMPPRVPGMDTVTRLAWRIRCGRTPEEAAVREYVYRWKLANLSMSFGAPHIIGM